MKTFWLALSCLAITFNASGAERAIQAIPVKSCHAVAADRGYRALQTTFVFAAASDLTSTFTLPTGYAEGNPFMGRSKPQQVVVTVSLAVATLYAAHRLYAGGRPRAAKIMLGLSSVFHGAMGISNYGHRYGK